MEGFGATVWLDRWSGRRGMAICLRGDIIADDLVDISIRRSEVLPYLAGSALWLRIDELDPGAKQSAARNRKVVDLKGHYWPAAEELVMFVLRGVDVNLGPVVQLESSRSVIDRKNIQIQHVSIERGHSVELERLRAHPAQASYLHSEPLRKRVAVGPDVEIDRRRPGRAAAAGGRPRPTKSQAAAPGRELRAERPSDRTIDSTPSALIPSLDDKDVASAERPDTIDVDLHASCPLARKEAVIADDWRPCVFRRPEL